MKGFRAPLLLLSVALLARLHPRHPPETRVFAARDALS